MAKEKYDRGKKLFKNEALFASLMATQLNDNNFFFFNTPLHAIAIIIMNSALMVMPANLSQLF